MFWACILDSVYQCSPTHLNLSSPIWCWGHYSLTFFIAFLHLTPLWNSLSFSHKLGAGMYNSLTLRCCKSDMHLLEMMPGILYFGVFLGQCNSFLHSVNAGQVSLAMTLISHSFTGIVNTLYCGLHSLLCCFVPSYLQNLWLSWDIQYFAYFTSLICYFPHFHSHIWRKIWVSLSFIPGASDLNFSLLKNFFTANFVIGFILHYFIILDPRCTYN